MCLIGRTKTESWNCSVHPEPAFQGPCNRVLCARTSFVCVLIASFVQVEIRSRLELDLWTFSLNVVAVARWCVVLHVFAYNIKKTSKLVCVQMRKKLRTLASVRGGCLEFIAKHITEQHSSQNQLRPVFSLFLWIRSSQSHKLLIHIVHQIFTNLYSADIQSSSNEEASFWMQNQINLQQRISSTKLRAIAKY